MIQGFQSFLMIKYLEKIQKTPPIFTGGAIQLKNLLNNYKRPYSIIILLKPVYKPVCHTAILVWLLDHYFF